MCSYNTVTSKHGVQFSCTGPGASTSPTEVSVDFFRDTVVSCEHDCKWSQDVHELAVEGNSKLWAASCPFYTTLFSRR